jgi:hypothetical protein
MTKTIFDSKVLDSLTRDILAKILINYANNIGCWLLKDDSLAIVQKEEFEEYVKQEQQGVKALFIKLIIAMQDQILKGYHLASSKHTEAETAKKEITQLRDDVTKLEENNTRQANQIETLTKGKEKLTKELEENMRTTEQHHKK